MKRCRVFPSIFSFLLYTQQVTPNVYMYECVLYFLNHPPTGYLLIRVAYGLVLKQMDLLLFKMSLLTRYSISRDTQFAGTRFILTCYKRNLLLASNCVKSLKCLLLKTCKSLLLLMENRNVFHSSSYLIKSDNSSPCFSCLAWTQLNNNSFLNILKPGNVKYLLLCNRTLFLYFGK
jgi:hypothetical protein